MHIDNAAIFPELSVLCPHALRNIWVANVDAGLLQQDGKCRTSMTTTEGASISPKVPRGLRAAASSAPSNVKEQSIASVRRDLGENTPSNSCFGDSAMASGT